MRTLLLGSRFTAPFIMLGCAYHTWQWWQAGGLDNTGYFTLILLGVSAKAAHEVHSYRQWQAAWRAMAPGGGERGWRPAPATIAGLLALVMVAIGMVWAQSTDAPPALHDSLPLVALGGAGLAVLLILGRCLMWLSQRLWFQRPRKLPVVALAITRPIRRPMAIRACYRRLPPYCQTLLRSGN